MDNPRLASDEDLRAAIAALGRPTNRGEEWLRNLTGTIQWVRSADEAQRATRDFQRRLWEDNYVAAIGQGQIRVDEALDNVAFRKWLAHRSMEPLTVRTKPRKKLASRARVPLPAPTRPNERWSMDFVSARTADGRWFRTLTVLDAPSTAHEQIRVARAKAGAGSRIS